MIGLLLWNLASPTPRDTPSKKLAADEILHIVYTRRPLSTSDSFFLTFDFSMALLVYPVDTVRFSTSGLAAGNGTAPLLRSGETKSRTGSRSFI